jgi:hypothetical protein
MRAGPPADGDFLRRIRQCLELYDELVPLRRARLLEELGSPAAARDRMRADADRSARQQEEALIRLQARLYGKGR